MNKKEKAIHTYAGKEHGSKQLRIVSSLKKQFSHYICVWNTSGWKSALVRALTGIVTQASSFIHSNLKRTWPYSIEMQLGETPGPVTGASKDYWKGRKPRRFHTGDMILIQDSLVQAQSKRNGDWWDPNGRLYTGGKRALTRFGFEKPKGEWNEVEIRVLGDKKATFVLNGEVVHEIMNSKKTENGELVPLTQGHIGLRG